MTSRNIKYQFLSKLQSIFNEAESYPELPRLDFIKRMWECLDYFIPDFQFYELHRDYFVSEDKKDRGEAVILSFFKGDILYKVVMDSCWERSKGWDTYIDFYENEDPDGSGWDTANLCGRRLHLNNFAQAMIKGTYFE